MRGALLLLLLSNPCDGLFARPRASHRRGRSARFRLCMGPIIKLDRPLGIVFEEIEPGKPAGVRVKEITDGGNADLDGRVFVGDELVAVSAVLLKKEEGRLTVGGSGFTNWERQMLPALAMDFDTVMDAIGSNTGRYGYRNVAIEVRRTSNSLVQAKPRRRGTSSGDTDGAVEDDGTYPIRAPKDNF